MLVNPTGKFVDRRPDGRHRPDRAQDHRRHLRRHGAATAAAPSRARIRRRSTARPPTPRATWRRTSSPPGSPTAASSRSPTRSASRTRSRVAGRDLRHRDGRRVATIEELVREHFDLRPGAIIRDLDLRRPIYAKTAAYGHFGRDDARLHVGADGQGRRAARGRRARRGRPALGSGSAVASSHPPQRLRGRADVQARARTSRRSSRSSPSSSTGTWPVDRLRLPRARRVRARHEARSS